MVKILNVSYENEVYIGPGAHQTRILKLYFLAKELLISEKKRTKNFGKTVEKKQRNLFLCKLGGQFQ